MFKLLQPNQESDLYDPSEIISALEKNQQPVAAKPVIYLYPEKEQHVSVKLSFSGELTYTYPNYSNGWDVIAHPDGTITNLADGSTYYYLFWEGKSRVDWKIDKGFIVSGDKTEAFLKEKLALMGLTPREYNDFITYWVPRMKANNYNLLSFSDEQYQASTILDIEPKPDSLLRIFMLWKPIKKQIDIDEQILEPFVRNGFTVVEWGGAELN